MPEENNVFEVVVPEGKDTVIITVPEGVEVKLSHTQKESPKELTETEILVNNILTISLTGILALGVIIAVICKAVSNKKAAKAPVVVKEAPAEPAPVAPGSAGQLKLHNVEPKTAAMLMAIVADKLQKPINELRFISIKEVN